MLKSHLTRGLKQEKDKEEEKKSRAKENWVKNGATIDCGFSYSGELGEGDNYNTRHKLR